MFKLIFYFLGLVNILQFIYPFLIRFEIKCNILKIKGSISVKLFNKIKFVFKFRVKNGYVYIYFNNKERKEKIDFSNPYLTSNLVIVVRKDSALANATSLADFAGAKIAAQDGTFHAEAATQITNRQGDNMIDFPTMLMALKARTIEGYIAEEPGAIADCQGNSELTYVNLINNQTGFTITDLTNVTIAVGVQKGSELLAKVNAALATISEEERSQLLVDAIAQAGVLGL